MTTTTETRKTALQADLDKWQAEVSHYDYEIQRLSTWRQHAISQRARIRAALAAYRREVGEIE